MFDLIDTHAHIDMEDFSLDQDDVIKRARDAGVNRIVNAGVTMTGSRNSIEFASKYQDTVFVGLGIHPQHAYEWEDKTYKEIIKMSDNKNVVAIGETGLDFFRDYCPHDTQIDVYRKHIRLAKETGKALIVHDRDAHDLIFNILKEEKGDEVKGVMHCFSGDYEFAVRCIEELDYYIAFNGIITFNKTIDAQQIAKDVPLEKIVLETDCPYLTPQPYRGKRNEPSYVVYTANKLAELKNLPVSKVIEVTTSNAEKLFGLKSRGI